MLASSVLLSHSWAVLQGNNRTEPMFGLTHQVTIGHLAVNAFFILSGYLVTESWFRSHGFRHYIAKRILRIYPGFFLCILVMLLTIVPLFGGVGLGSVGLPLALLGAVILWPPTVPGVFPQRPLSGTLNGSLWTISYEFGCYLCLAFLLFTGRHRPRVMLVVGCVSVLAQVIITLVWGWFPATEFAVCFLGGSLFYCYRDAIPRRLFLSLVSLAILLGLNQMAGRWLLALAPLFMVYPMLYLCSAPVVRNVRSDYSYGVYLYAFPLAQAVGTSFPNIQPLQLALVAFLPTLLLGALSWHFIEHPCLKLKQAFTMTRSVRDRPAA